MDALPTPARRATASMLKPAQPASPNSATAASATRRSTSGSRGRPGCIALIVTWSHLSSRRPTVCGESCAENIATALPDEAHRTGGRVPIPDETIGDFLDQLAERVPAPGGGAVSALQAAQGAALLGMVARYTTGEKYAEHQLTIGRIITEVDELRAIALRLAEADVD